MSGEVQRGSEGARRPASVGVELANFAAAALLCIATSAATAGHPRSPGFLSPSLPLSLSCLLATTSIDEIATASATPAH